MAVISNNIYVAATVVPTQMSRMFNPLTPKI